MEKVSEERWKAFKGDLESEADRKRRIFAAKC
jgi:hypothetical protein